jgi:hypothetical protein
MTTPIGEPVDGISRGRRVAFVTWVGLVTATLGIGAFGVTSLLLAWFQTTQGVANPVTELGYGTIVGIFVTGGLLVQLRAPERKIAGIQQAALAATALVISAPLAEDHQNLVPGLVTLVAVGVVVGLHPARREFIRRGSGFSLGLAALALVAAVPFGAYTFRMAAEAKELAGPPHHVQRLATMAAMAIAVVLVGLLACLQTRGWRIPAWNAGAAAVVFGLGSVLFPDVRGSVGLGWGAFATGGRLLFVTVAEWRARRLMPESR